MFGRPADLDNPGISDFCKSIVSDLTPSQIICIPAKNARQNDCFKIVSQQVIHHGGRAVTGWAIWEYPGVMVEAEFHQVWQRPSDGQLIDLNRRDFPLSVITFLHDPSRQYQGRQVGNRRQALLNNPLVHKWIALSEREFALLNDGDRAEQHEVELSDAEYQEYSNIQIEKVAIQRLLFRG